jgi:Uma2 family endonuclease
MSAQPLPRITLEEYLEIDRKAEIRSEYYDGQMYAMSGASYAHGKIAISFAAELLNGLNGRCEVSGPDTRVRVLPQRTYVYPDVIVVCGTPVFADDQKDTILNPRLIVEVLSPGTEAHDRGYKFSLYRKLESLQEYVLVSQNEPRIEVFRRQPSDQWLLTDFEGLDATCRLDSIDCSIALASVYRQVTFEPAALANLIAPASA